MKLRFHGNTLRLRLSQSDVARFAEIGEISEVVRFAGDQTLSYEIESADRDGIAAIFENDSIRILLPAATAQRWVESDDTGMEGWSGPLRVIVEKDFQCLHKDAAQDADAFPNPLVENR
jgi:hypothetical protein